MRPPPPAARRRTVGLEVDACASLSVKLTVILSPIPALPPVIVGAALKAGATVSTVKPAAVLVVGEG